MIKTKRIGTGSHVSIDNRFRFKRCVTGCGGAWKVREEGRRGVRAFRTLAEARRYAASRWLDTHLRRAEVGALIQEHYTDDRTVQILLSAALAGDAEALEALLAFLDRDCSFKLEALSFHLEAIRAGILRRPPGWAL